MVLSFLRKVQSLLVHALRVLGTLSINNIYLFIFLSSYLYKFIYKGCYKGLAVKAGSSTSIFDKVNFFIN